MLAFETPASAGNFNTEADSPERYARSSSASMVGGRTQPRSCSAWLVFTAFELCALTLWDESQPRRDNFHSLLRTVKAQRLWA